MLPEQMSNCLPTERQLDKLRLVIDVFKIGGDRGPIWRFKKTKRKIIPKNTVSLLEKPVPIQSLRQRKNTIQLEERKRKQKLGT